MPVALCRPAVAPVAEAVKDDAQNSGKRANFHVNDPTMAEVREAMLLYGICGYMSTQILRRPLEYRYRIF